MPLIINTTHRLHQSRTQPLTRRGHFIECLPSKLLNFLHGLRPLMRAEVFDSFCFLLIGMLVGEAIRVKGFLSSEHPLQANEALELEAWLKSRDPDSPILFPSRPTDQPLNARCLK